MQTYDGVTYSLILRELGFEQYIEDADLHFAEDPYETEIEHWDKHVSDGAHWVKLFVQICNDGKHHVSRMHKTEHGWRSTEKPFPFDSVWSMIHAIVECERQEYPTWV